MVVKAWLRIFKLASKICYELWLQMVAPRRSSDGAAREKHVPFLKCSKTIESTMSGTPKSWIGEDCFCDKTTLKVA